MESTNSSGRVLRQLGMHPKYRGYAYLQFVLCEIEKCPEALYRLSEIVYPRLMEKFGVSRVSIDRNIRFVIERMWDSGDKERLDGLFGVDGAKRLPSNREFISVLFFLLYSGDDALS